MMSTPSPRGRSIYRSLAIEREADNVRRTMMEIRQLAGQIGSKTSAGEVRTQSPTPRGKKRRESGIPSPIEPMSPRKEITSWVEPSSPTEYQGAEGKDACQALLAPRGTDKLIRARHPLSNKMDVDSGNSNGHSVSGSGLQPTDRTGEAVAKKGVTFAGTTPVRPQSPPPTPTIHITPPSPAIRRTTHRHATTSNPRSPSLARDLAQNRLAHAVAAGTPDKNTRAIHMQSPPPMFLTTPTQRKVVRGIPISPQSNNITSIYSTPPPPSPFQLDTTTSDVFKSSTSVPSLKPASRTSRTKLATWMYMDEEMDKIRADFQRMGITPPRKEKEKKEKPNIASPLDVSQWVQKWQDEDWAREAAREAADSSDTPPKSPSKPLLRKMAKKGLVDNSLLKSPPCATPTTFTHLGRHARFPATPASRKLTPQQRKQLMEEDPGAFIKTSKDIVPALDRALDEHLEEHVRKGRTHTFSGQRISDLLERTQASAKKGNKKAGHFQ